MKITGIGDFVRRAREEQGLTQTELAEKTGISRARISQIEGGRVALPNVGHRRAIAQALGISNVDLLIAAHELDDDELIRLGLEGVVERPANDVRAQLHAAVDAVPNWELTRAAHIAEGLIWTMQAVCQDQTTRPPGASSNPAPPLASSGRGR